MDKTYGKAKKVMMIGIDGYDPVYAKPLLDNGKLPNIAKFLSKGVTTQDGAMVGAMPNYTPPNWCSMATGVWPGTHGITDFWNHTTGDDLDKLSIGFDSNKCHAEYIHDAFAREGKKSIVVGWPTTWPPTNEHTILVDGSGIHPFLTECIDYEKFYDCVAGDFEPVLISHKANDSGADCFVTEDNLDKNFELEYAADKTDSSLDLDESAHAGAVDRIKSAIKDAKGWAKDVGKAKETVLLINNGLERRYALLIAEDGINYTKVEVYASKKDTMPLATMVENEWSDYIKDQFQSEQGKINGGYKLKVMTLAKDGSQLTMYGTFASSLDSKAHVFPENIKTELYQKFGGPIMLSNCGRKDPIKLQIIYEVACMGFRWTMDIIDYLLETKEWDLALHGLHIIDLGNHAHLDHVIAEEENYLLHRSYLEKYYQLADEYVGRALKWLDQDVAMIIASDHGGLIIGDDSLELGNAWVLNIGVMAELGYTKLKMENGKQVIDWGQTTAIAQRSSYIYVNLMGRDPKGIVAPEDYDQLVEKIIDDLYSYRDPKTGRRVVGMALNKADMAVVHLGGDHVGDIFYTMEPDFAHDQGNSLPNATRMGSSIKCLFMAAGSGIKSNVIIDRKVEMIDLVPTLCHLAGVDMPHTVEGGVIYQLLEK